jgi:twitching motility protein PilT
MAAPDTKRSPPVEQLLGAMEGWGASDLFVCAGKKPGVRLHGEVVPLDVAPTPPDEIERFLAHALTADRLDEFQRTGDLDVGFALRGGIRFRLNLSRQLGLVSIVARALPNGALAFADLGLPDTLRAWAERTRGLVLVTGAAGSGKSTTSAAILHHVNRTRPAHVVTIEDPIEFVHTDDRARISQREVGADTASFEVALRQVLRESPDVIFLGELRSPEATRVALQAALTGHLVLATLHTVDVCQTVQRVVGLFPEAQAAQVALDLSLSLVGIASQRLVPNHDGSGRVAAVEHLEVSPAAAHLIRERRLDELGDLIRGSTDPATVSFDHALVAIRRAGKISHASGVAHASQPDEFERLARGMGTGIGAAGWRNEADAPAALDIRALLKRATEQGASDLHLSVGRPPVLRVGGELVAQDLPALGVGDMRMLLHSIMNARQRGAYELDREMDFSLALEDGDRFRVNAYFERGHMAAAFRTIHSRVPDATTLGLPRSLLQMGEEPHGLLLVAGPTGAGKTTTLACLVDRINHARNCHVVTIEDPIEYVHASLRATVHQREVHADTRGFAQALRFVLRQDPDVILIGEMRDLETVSSALTAAETGHLVLATLHTNDAAQTIDRVVDVFPPHQQSQARAQLAACLLGVVSQRLLPRSDGKGRVAAFEVMIANAAIRTLIREGKMHQALGLMQTGRAAGMVTLDMALEELVRQGAVAKDEAARYMVNPQTLDRPQPPPLSTVPQEPRRGR